MISNFKTNLFLLTLYLSLITGFFLNEDLLGGAYSDYQAHFHLGDKFSNNLKFTFLNYDALGHRHSPVFFIFKSITYNLGDFIQRLFFVHIFLLIPVFLYKCLKQIYSNSENKNNLKLISGIIILFPTFRAYSIWPDSHLFGSLFFLVSIYYFLKFQKNKNNIGFALTNTFFLSLSAYVSPNFGIFVFYFIYEYYRSLDSLKNFFFIILTNFILSIPFFYYVFILDINFIFNNNGWDIGENIFSIKNISNKFIIILSLFLFYLIPFFSKIYKNFYLDFLTKKKIYYIFLLILFIIICDLFNFEYAYNLTNSGGGIFYNLSKLIFKNDYFLFLLSFISYLILINISFFKLGNLIIFLCLLVSNPQITIWQANFSPTLFFLILLLFKFKINENFVDYKIVKINYIYFILYLISNIIIRLI